MYAERLLPHDPEAEEAVVGSVLIDGEAISKVTAFLKPNDFYVEKARLTYEACAALAQRGEPINQVSVGNELSVRDSLERIGGTSYLGHLVSTVPTSVHIEHYGRIVQRTATMRQLIGVAGDIAAIGYEADPDVDTSLGRAEDLLFRVRSGRGTRDFVHIREVLDTYMEGTASLNMDQGEHLAPIPTGFSQLDELLGNGMQRSDMIVLAARPSLGKSSLAFNIARHAAEQGSSVGIFSLEMSAEQIAIRLLSGQSNVDSHRLRLGLVSDAEERRVLDTIGLLSELPLYIDDTPIQGIVEMRGKARRLQTEKGLDLVIVDYLQLLTSSSRIENRAQEMGEFSRSIKGIARDLDVPVLACSQLSRAPEQRPNHRPILSDLRESGSIEQDADVVAFLYREDKYTTPEEWDIKNPTEPYPRNMAELIISKHRNGQTGMIPLYFREELVRFESLDRSVTSREFA